METVQQGKCLLHKLEDQSPYLQSHTKATWALSPTVIPVLSRKRQISGGSWQERLKWWTLPSVRDPALIYTMESTWGRHPTSNASLHLHLHTYVHVPNTCVHTNVNVCTMHTYLCPRTAGSSWWERNKMYYLIESRLRVYQQSVEKPCPELLLFSEEGVLFAPGFPAKIIAPWHPFFSWLSQQRIQISGYSSCVPSSTVHDGHHSSCHVAFSFGRYSS